MKKLEDALLKKALGYTCEEVVEEYGQTEDGFSLTKKKVTKKHVPPDLGAIRAYLELEGVDDTIADMSMDELLAERQRLIAELQNKTPEDRKNGSKKGRPKGQV